MNTYRENLRETIAASLQSQALDQKALKSQSIASIFTLYFAQGMLLAAEDQLETARQTMTKKRPQKNMRLVLLMFRITS